MAMYAKEMSQRDIEDTLKEIYGAEISQGLVSRITDKIAAGLERDGILTGAGNPRWHTSTVAKILRNEKYMGDALLQKTYTVDYLSKKQIKNNGIMPQYYVENDHEAIIPKEIFMRLQDNLAVVLRGYADDEALKIDKRLSELQQELINHASRKEDYNDIADEILRLREMKQKNFTDTAVRDEQVKRINELNEFIEQQDSELTEFDESLARRWLNEIVVWDDRFSVELKSGVRVEVLM